jgi:hypothetical protein
MYAFNVARGRGDRYQAVGPLCCRTIELAVSDSYSHEVYSVHIVGAHYVPEQPLNMLSVSDVLHIN